jgi:hypothetical protein
MLITSASAAGVDLQLDPGYFLHTSHLLRASTLLDTPPYIVCDTYIFLDIILVQNDIIPKEFYFGWRSTFQARRTDQAHGFYSLCGA